MKCATCNYEYKDEYVNENGARFYKPIIGDNEFIQINGNFTIKIEGDWYNAIQEIDLYACPKCGTVRIEKWF